MACATLVDDYPQGRVSEWLVFCGKYQLATFRIALEDMGAEGAAFDPVTRISVGGREKKSPGGRAAFRSLRGQGER